MSLLAIDFGESFCKVAYNDAGTGRTELVRLLDGDIQLASVVCYGTHTTSVGKSVLDRFITGSISSSCVLRRIKPTLLHESDSNSGGRALDGFAFILKTLKRAAEKELRQPARSVIITCPVYCTLGAKARILQAAERADLHVLHLIPDSVAAAIYFLSKIKIASYRVMVYDHGGGGLNIAIVEKSDAGIQVKAFDGDLCLGGIEFDKRLAEHVWNCVRDQGYDVCSSFSMCRGCCDELERLTCFIEPFKVSLSISEKVQIQTDLGLRIVDHRRNRIGVRMEVTRQQFEGIIERYVERGVRMCRWVASRMFRPVSCRAQDSDSEQPLSYWRINNALHEVILVGGSSQIPLIQRRLCMEWGSPPICCEPHFATAFGALLPNSG